MGRVAGKAVVADGMQPIASTRCLATDSIAGPRGARIERPRFRWRPRVRASVTLGIVATNVGSGGCTRAVRREEAVLVVLGHTAQPPPCAVWRQIRWLSLAEDGRRGFESDGDLVNAPQLLWALSRSTSDLLAAVRAVRREQAVLVVLDHAAHRLNAPFGDGSDGWTSEGTARAG